MGPRDHRRVDADGHRLARVATTQLRDREQLDDRAHLAGRLHVGRGDLGDALAVDVVDGHAGVEREAGEDRRLRGRVEALHVGGRVGLGVAELLGLLERLGEAAARGVHLVEDEVGGAVDDAEHPRDPIARERLAQRAQDRDRARDGRLVEQVASGPVRGGVERRAVGGEQRLVGRHDRGAVVEGTQDQRAGRLDATDDLDDEVGPRDQLLRVGREQAVGDLHLARRVEPAYGDAHELERRAHARGQVTGLLVEQAHHLRAHRSAAEHRDLQRWSSLSRLHQRSPTSVANRSASVSRRTITRATPSRTLITGGRSAWL